MMRTTKILAILILALWLVVWQAGISKAEPIGTAFTYQGRLNDNGSPADGLYDFQFKLFDESSDEGNQVGNDLYLPEVDVTDGYFTVELDFADPNIFSDDALWLQIGVRPGELEDPSEYTLLSPRQKITPTPYALYAKNADESAALIASLEARIAALETGWGIAEQIEQAAEDSTSPQVAVDAGGNAVAVWRYFYFGLPIMVSNRYVPGTGWGPAELIHTNYGYVRHPQIAGDAAGNAVVVWMQDDGTRNSILSNRYVAGTGWGTDELIETEDLDAEYPQVAVDGSGNAVAVWMQSDLIRYNIWSNRYVAGTGWSAAELIETGKGNAEYPQVAVDGVGNAVAVWQQYDGTRNNIWSNRYVPRTGWSAAELIETNNAGSAERPQVAVDDSGKFVAVWHQSDGIQYTNIWSNRYVAGTGWETAKLVETHEGDALNPQVAVDGVGNAVVVWQQSDGTRYNIWSNRYVVGTGWSATELVETDNSRNASTPQIAVDVSGNAVAVWHQSDGTRSNIWSNHYVVGAGWATAELIETDNAGNAEYPQVALSADGNAVAVWQQSDGILWNIWSNRYERK
jgi:hypothetical protein